MVDDPAEGPVTLEAWREVWRRGFAPSLSTPGLVALRKGLAEGDPRLLQGETTAPPPWRAAEPPRAACPVAYCGWLGEGLATVAAVEEYFGNVCAECNDLLEDVAGCRWLLNWIDDTPRDAMIPELLAEVDAELARREAAP